jgi:hypothetical protein
VGRKWDGRAPEEIGNAARERGLRPHDCQIDTLVFREREDRVGVGRIDGKRSTGAGDTRVAGRARDRRDSGFA